MNGTNETGSTRGDANPEEGSLVTDNDRRPLEEIGPRRDPLYRETLVFVVSHEDKRKALTTARACARHVDHQNGTPESNRSPDGRFGTPGVQLESKSGAAKSFVFSKACS